MIEKTKLIHRDLIEGNLVMIDNEESWPQLKGKVLKIVDSYIAKSKLITANFPKSKRIVIVVDEDGTEYDQLDEFIRPIPLSEDVLVKLGYKKSRGPHRYELNGIFINILKTDSGTSFWLNGGKPICWVHKLQNYHYENRNEELIYTP